MPQASAGRLFYMENPFNQQMDDKNRGKLPMKVRPRLSVMDDHEINEMSKQEPW